MPGSPEAASFVLALLKSLTNVPQPLCYVAIAFLGEGAGSHREATPPPLHYILPRERAMWLGGYPGRTTEGTVCALLYNPEPSFPANHNRSCLDIDLWS